MSTHVRTRRTRRTLIDRLMWRRAYLTKIFDGSREVIGRGSTPEASLEAAEWRWVTELPTGETPAGAVMVHCHSNRINLSLGTTDTPRQQLSDRD